MNPGEPDGLWIPLPEREKIRRTDIAKTRLPGGVPVDLEGQCPVMDEPAGSGELPEDPFLSVGRSQGEPEGLTAFHGSHFTTNRGTPYISVLNDGVLRRFWIKSGMKSSMPDSTMRETVEGSLEKCVSSKIIGNKF